MAAGAVSNRNLGPGRQERSVRAPRDAQWLARSLFCYSPDPTICTIAFRRIPHIKALRASPFAFAIARPDPLSCAGRARPGHHVGQAVRDRRFRFGDNWLDFARSLNANQLSEAERSLRRSLERDTLAGLSFLDIGSGSGLFSLAARKLGARVRSFDFDEDSVLCTAALRDRYFAGDGEWTIEQGSILDGEYVRSLGAFDVVYAWGVLHHTGAMHDALGAAARLVAPGGLFTFALYHRTMMCGLWRREKRWYSGASLEAQRRARAVYVALLRTAFFLTGRDFQSYVSNY